MKHASVKHIIFTLLALSFSIAKSQQVGVNSVTVRFENEPSTWSVEKAPLKYNKDFALAMHMDDNAKDIYTHAYPLLNGGTVGGITYPGLYYTDGCGNDIPFKMGVSIFSFEQGGTVDGHDPNGPYANLNVTWPELIELFQNEWGVYNHGLTSSNSLDPYYSIRRNHSYVKRKMLSATSGGPEMKVFVNPNGDNTFTTPAFNADYIVAYRQFSFGVPSFDVTAYTVGDSLRMGRSSLEGSTSLLNIANNMAAVSTGGAHHFGSTFNHSITGGAGYTFPVFRAYMNAIANSYGKQGDDNIWMTTEEEIIEYLMNSENISLNTQLIGTDLIISFDGTLRTDFRFYALSLVVSANENIDTIFVDGGTANSFTGVDTNNALINLEWDGYVQVPDTVNAETYVSIAEQTQDQYDWNIAMDYVEIVPPGPTKEAFRDRLCAIPGINYPEGYCFCTTTAGPDTTICEGTCVTLTAGDGASWEWSTGDTTQSIYVCPDDDSTFVVTVYNSVGCPANDTVEVGVAPYPVPDAGSDTTICNGTCAELTATGGVRYEWNTGDTTQTIEVCPEDTTMYYVTVYSEYECDSADSVQVNVVESPIAYAGEDTSICMGDCATLTASGGVSYVWNTGDSTQSIEVCPTDTMSYVVTVYAVNDCFDSDTVQVNVMPLPVPEAGADTTVCRGDTAYLTASGGISYEWSTGDTTASIRVTPEDTTEYFVTVGNQYECNAQDSVTVNVLPTPDPVINNGNDTVICLGDCAELRVNYSEGVLWSTGETSQTITVCPDTSMKYFVEVSNANGCSGMDSIMVEVSQPPTADAGSDTTICEGECATLEATGGVNYIWSSGDSTFYSIVCPDTDSMFYVTVFNQYGCHAEDSVEVFVMDKPDLNVTPDTGVCMGECIELTAEGGTTYDWSTGDTASEIVVCPEVPTMYYVETQNINACRAIDSVLVDIYPKPVTNLPHDTSNCTNNCITLTSEEGEQFFWSTGDTTQSIEVCPEEQTTYYLTVVSELGCVSEDSSRVSIKPSTEAYIYDFIPAYCQTDDSVRLYGYPPGGEFLGEGVVLHDDIAYFSPDSAGPGISYVVYAYTNEVLCTYRDTVVTYVYETPTVRIGNDTTVCNNEFLTLAVEPEYDTYLWSDGTTDPVTTILPGDLGLGLQEFGIIVTTDGCAATDEITLNVIICNPGIEEYSHVPQIDVFPNPAENKLEIRIDGEEKDISLEVLNIRGEVMRTEEFHDCNRPDFKQKLDLSFLQPGLYLLKFYNNNFFRSIKLIIR